VWGEKLRQSVRALPNDFAMRMRQALDEALKPRGLLR
jgi:hypothetical protein